MFLPVQSKHLAACGCSCWSCCVCSRRTALFLRFLAIGTVVILATFVIALAVGTTAESCCGAATDEELARYSIAAATLANFSSCSEVAGALRVSPGDLTDYYYGIELSERYQRPLAASGGRVEVVAIDSADASGHSSPSRSSSADFSTTNVQVAGIDESDWIKTDGDFIYSVGGHQLVIVRARPASKREVVSRTSLRADRVTKDARFLAAEQALLSGDSLLVMSAAELRSKGRTLQALVIQAWDVSDPSQPELVRTRTIEGRLATGRLVGDYAMLAVGAAVHLDGDPPTEESEEAILPVWHAGDDGDDSWDPQPAVQCSEISYVEEVQGRSLAMLYAVRMTGKDAGKVVDRHATAVGTAWSEIAVVATNDSFYLATYNQQWWCPHESDCAHSAWWCSEAARLARQGRGGCEYRDGTVILAFTLDSGKITLRATGTVPGYLLNQFSMDEHEGHLRVAFSRNAWGRACFPGTCTWRACDCSDSGVDVLDKYTLTRVGRVAGLGRGERIYAVRFVGAVGYLITFRLIDPLFTLDLSDPTNPHVLGELKIPGYSDYLHPINKTALLGVGHDGTDEGLILGVKVSLFDVSNLAEPKEHMTYALEDETSTPVSRDHKAFYWHPSENLVVLPVQLDDYSRKCFPRRSSARILHVGDHSIERRGSISHDAAREARKSEGWETCVSQCDGAFIWRALHIGDTLFTISDGEIVASGLDDLERKWSAQLHTPHVLVSYGFDSCSLNDDSNLDWRSLIFNATRAKADNLKSCKSGGEFDYDLNTLANTIHAISVPIHESPEACCAALNNDTTTVTSTTTNSSSLDNNVTTAEPRGNSSITTTTGLCSSPDELDVLSDCAPEWHPCAVFIY
mmetsp:Transcript_8055/g.19635  ORF Transcript_8055/g.19635 Transcript_8055/m.19635 type:complete len:858 (+) Transcript_8055:124-2697(+)